MNEHCQPDRQDCYAVMGNPIAHSKSPQIHCRFAEQTGQPLGYDALLVDTDGFRQAVTEFFAAGGKGLNVTVPFKQEAWQLSATLSPRAELAGAVNTLLPGADDQLRGDNTDGAGLVRDLQDNLGVTLKNKQVLMLGAGGAARGVLAPLLEQEPASIHIANRTVLRATELCDTFSEFGELSASGFDDIDCGPFDIVINATSAGLSGEVPALPDGVISTDSCCYDMVYGTQPTAFMRYASQLGCRNTHDGLGMLVEQAAESFYLWRGIKPETGTVISALRVS